LLRKVFEAALCWQSPAREARPKKLRRQAGSAVSGTGVASRGRENWTMQLLADKLVELRMIKRSAMKQSGGRFKQQTVADEAVAHQ